MSIGIPKFTQEERDRLYRIAAGVGDTFEPEELNKLLTDGYKATMAAMKNNLSTDYFTGTYEIRPLPPRSWLLRKSDATRSRLGSWLIDLASWILGYDVRGDW